MSIKGMLKLKSSFYLQKHIIALNTGREEEAKKHLEEYEVFQNKLEELNK